ncbi:MAG: universal stress protein [Desulfuromonadaceae bacterium]|nr:universal stress protein [Desulfuromonadaceae bacterium]
MFKHLLVPTDGSPLSEKAVKGAVSFAKETKAQLTFFFVVPDETTSIYGEAALLQSIDPQLASKTISQHIQNVLNRAQSIAESAGVPCQLLSAVSNEPFEAIIAAAENGGCDLILMASHGYRGVKGLLLGSQTQKVLTHSTIPVLVYR